jgi:UDP-N-acetylglucosamine--N-acetylmuramyl-(pentapeptide) pyrophosphoryl-undecaprenol N-acetylglucosamine transferase
MLRTIVLTGGGTAGHVTPNLAIIPKLEEKGFHIEYIGTKDGMEKEIITCTDIPYHTISAGKLRRYFSFKNFTDPIKLLAGCLKAGRILKKLRPAAVFSKGGFVSVPVVFAAHRRKIPVVLHESDYTPGLANRLCIPRADKICVAFEPTLKFVPVGKGICTGLPIRRELLCGDRETGLSMCGFSGEKPVLLIMGGSLGAKALNDTIDDILPELTKKFDVIHIRGKNNLRSGFLPCDYKQFDFISCELPHIYAAADIMVSRAGATAVFEILSLALPSLLVPLPKATSRGDQILNADYFFNKGFSHVLEQEKMTSEKLLSDINELYAACDILRENMKRENMSDAAEKVAEVIANAAR